MVRIDPIPPEPAATATLEDGRDLLVLADYHAGIESAIRWEAGLDLPSRAPDRRAGVEALIDRTDPDRIVFLGDLMHAIGPPKGAERGELEVLFEAIDRPITIVRGNHDGRIHDILEDDRATGADLGSVEIADTDGINLGGVGFVHGHAWPSSEVLAAEIIVSGHEHPCVRLTDEVGGTRIERVWLRGRLDPAPFRHRLDDGAGGGEAARADPEVRAAELVVMPAFNELVGGTWVNEPEQAFLSPFLPDACPDAEAYLLDGTRLGPFAAV